MEILVIVLDVSRIKVNLRMLCYSRKRERPRLAKIVVLGSTFLLGRSVEWVFAVLVRGWQITMTRIGTDEVALI